LKISALSCYNTHEGPHVFKKLAVIAGDKGDRKAPSWNDSHPLPMDRERRLLKQSKIINCDDNPNCHGVLERIIKGRRERKHHRYHH